MNKERYLIKRATAGDDRELFSQLSALDKDCVGAEGWSPDSFRSEAEKDNGHVLYIMNEGAVIALLCGYTAVGEADITSVAVAAAYRRRGLAAKLISEFENELPEDTESIFLEVRESNAAAISLYNKCGFERLSLRRDLYIDPRENAVVMIKKLKG